MVLAAVCLIYAGLQNLYYKIISQETLIGTIKCAKSTDNDYDLYLLYLPGINQPKYNSKLIELKGNEWGFEGEIIKWDRPLNLIGLKTIHRPISIFDSTGNRFSLESEFEKFLFKIYKSAPGVDTSFISIVKQTFTPKIKFGVFLTNSGYLVRKIR